MKFHRIYFLLSLLFLVQLISAQNTYRVSTVRAAPGKLMHLIDVYKEIRDKVVNKDHKPLIIRHSQGDQWDLMVVEFSEAVESEFLPGFGDDLFDMVSMHEELIVDGPAWSEARAYLDANNYFHVEMFISLAGKQKELLEQRRMENSFLSNMDRPQNLIFTSKFGGRWDIFTLGGYRDLKHYAASADISLETEDAAAKQAGFEGVTDIGFYLRSLILEHHDTLANKVK